MFTFPSFWLSISLLSFLIKSLLHDGVNSYFSLLKLPTKTAAIMWEEDPRLKKKKRQQFDQLNTTHFQPHQKQTHGGNRYLNWGLDDVTRMSLLGDFTDTEQKKKAPVELWRYEHIITREHQHMHTGYFERWGRHSL